MWKKMGFVGVGQTINSVQYIERLVGCELFDCPWGRDRQWR